MQNESCYDLFCQDSNKMERIKTIHLGHSHKLERKFKVKFFQLIAWLLTFFLAETDGLAETVKLSLSQTLEIIEDENLQVLINRQVVEETLQRSYIERARLLPSLSLESVQIRTQFVNVGRGFEFPSPPPVNRFDAKISGDFPLFNANNYASYRLAKFQHEISELNYKSVLEEILEATAITYLTHLRNLKRIEVLDANIIRDRVLLNLAEAQFQAGVAARIDVTRAEGQLATDEKVRLQQDTLVMRSELQLKRLLKLNLEADLQLEYIELNNPDQSQAFNFSLEHIHELRPDYIEAAHELTRNRYAKKAANLEKLPTVQVFGEYGYATEEAFDGNEDDAWIVGLYLSFPIFEGFRIRSNIHQALAAIRRQELAVEDLQLEINSEYILARQDARSRFKQIDIVRKKVELSDEELELARNRFEGGVADNRDLTDAQASLAEANDELVDAVYLYNLSRLELARARGDVRLLISE